MHEAGEKGHWSGAHKPKSGPVCALDTDTTPKNQDSKVGHEVEKNLGVNRPCTPGNKKNFPEIYNNLTPIPSRSAAQLRVSQCTVKHYS